MSHPIENSWLVSIVCDADARETTELLHGVAGALTIEAMERHYQNYLNQKGME